MNEALETLRHCLLMAKTLGQPTERLEEIVQFHELVMNKTQEALQQSAELFTNGSVTFPIMDYSAQISKIEVPLYKGHLHFSVLINGLSIGSCLLYEIDAESFKVEIPEPMWSTLDPQRVLRVCSGKTPYAAVLSLIYFHKPQFVVHLAHRQRLTEKIVEELNRFRNTLVRKYRQLTYVDDYETVEMDAFLAEAKRFVRKRLPEVRFEDERDWAVNVIVSFVSKWASEEDAPSKNAEFEISMSPTDYERFCADRLAGAGWEVHLTKASGDQGADIICEANGRRLVVQCKLYSGSVGNAAVQEVIAAREFEYADFAAVISNAPYTSAAQKLASTARVHLLHHDEISQLDVNTA
jgi:restriction system protein